VPESLLIPLSTGTSFGAMSNKKETDRCDNVFSEALLPRELVEAIAEQAHPFTALALSSTNAALHRRLDALDQRLWKDFMTRYYDISEVFYFVRSISLIPIDDVDRAMVEDPRGRRPLASSRPLCSSLPTAVPWSSSLTFLITN